MLGFGVAGFGADRVGETLEALKRLCGDGYTREDGSVHVEELASWAQVFALALSAMDSVEASAFVLEANELLEDWERLTGSPNTGEDTVQSRQERLAALFGILGRPQDCELALTKMGLDVTFEPNAGSTSIDDENATPGAIYVTSIVANEAITPRATRLVRWVLRAAFPAWAWGGIDRPDPAENLVRHAAIEWAGDQIVGMSRIGDAEALAQARPRSRFRDWCIYSSLRARDLNEVEARTMLGASAGLLQQPSQPREFWFTCSINNASSKDVTLAGGIDFRKRLVRVMWRVSATDVRPGQAGDTGFNTASTSKTLWYTGTGGAGYAYTSGAIDLTASAVDGHLVLSNSTGGTRYVTIWIELSGAVDLGSSGAKPALLAATDPPAEVSAIDAGLTADWWAEARDGVSQRAADGSGADAWSGFPTSQFGGLVRVVSLGASTRPASNALTYYADRNIDWRDRLLAVFACGVNDSHGALGAPGDAQVTVDETLMWTGSGIGIGNAALQSYAVAIGQFRLGVDSLTGALVIEHHTGSGWAQLSCTLVIHATDQLGKRTSATALAMPTVPVDNAPVLSTQLNFLQDVAMASQGRARDGDEPWFTQSVFDDRNAPLSPAMLSFGAELRGSSDTKLPARFTRAFADGQLRQVIDALTGAVRTERRDAPQAAFGRLRRVFSASVANGVTSDVDATDDWRDRVIVAWVAVSSSDLRPLQAADNTVAANHYRVELYAGAGARELQLGATNVFVGVSSSGVLQVRNASGGTRYVAGWLEASFQCGCR